ncbi:hypothetical protein pah_c184o002 [Parachlamydia acanthamoebae str. Hall's coccus]|nr:hypothetical protein pah_c184o002 [Parachlamydia acanthamoebae str. Hall's coccus]
MGVNDILGKHSGGSHVNFELLIRDLKTGRMAVENNCHIFLID